jgi:hypothetical protein
MESNWAAENLQTIRTLMERSAVYRRALAPVMTYAGVVGIIGGAAGQLLGMTNGGVSLVFWMLISLVAIGGAVLLVRRQAMKSGEPFWSPPTRRIAQAMFPPLLIGCVLGILMTLWSVQIVRAVWSMHDYRDSGDDLLFLMPVWAVLYGLALNSAGFFMPRGIKLFGWLFILAGLGLFVILDGILQAGIFSPHLLMGVLFGCSHLAYGIYLYFTESRKNESLSET